MNMTEPNGLASWILYYLERAIYIQFNINVHGLYVNETIDLQKQQSIILSTDSKMISLHNEMKPFWRTFCQ